MAKRLSDKQKEQLTQEFIDGKTINDLVEEFSSTKVTISRYLKKKSRRKSLPKVFREKKKLQRIIY